MSSDRLDFDQFLSCCVREELRVIPWIQFVKDVTILGNANPGYSQNAPCEADCENGAPLDETFSSTCKIRSFTSNAEENQLCKNPISELNEYCQITLRNKCTPEFTYTEIDKLFKCTASIKDGNHGYKFADAISRTKKDAKTLAAKQLMYNIRNNTTTSSSDSYDSSKDKLSSYSELCQSGNEKNYVSLLHEYCAKMRIAKPEAHFEERSKLFYCTVKIDNSYGYGSSSRKKDSKEAASRDLLQKLQAKSGKIFEFSNF